MTCCGGATVEQEFLLDASTNGEDSLPDKPILSVPRSREGLLASNKLAEIQAPPDVRSRITWRPPVDIFFDKKESMLVLLTDLAGFTKDEITVEVGEGHLYLSGPRSRNELKEKYGANLVLTVHERPTGYFYRVFQLPPNAVEESVHAVLMNGLLEVKLKCLQTHEMRKIEVSPPEKGSKTEDAKAKSPGSKNEVPAKA